MEHFTGGTYNTLSAKALILCKLLLQSVFGFVFNNCPVTYPTAHLAFGLSQVEVLNSAVNMTKSQTSVFNTQRGRTIFNTCRLSFNLHSKIYQVGFNIPTKGYCMKKTDLYF
jgi:hypothetical protein